MGARLPGVTASASQKHVNNSALLVVVNDTRQSRTIPNGSRNVTMVGKLGIRQRYGLNQLAIIQPPNNPNNLRFIRPQLKNRFSAIIFNRPSIYQILESM